MSGFSLTSILVEVEILTTAGILRSSMGANDGMGVPSTEGGSPAASDTGIKLVYIDKRNNSCFADFVFIRVFQRLLIVRGRQYRIKNV